MSTSGKRAPPQLIFDDGSRAMTEESVDDAPGLIETPASIRGEVSLEVYYEIERITNEIASMHSRKKKDEEQTELLRVALQFPDELLDDSPEVCWLLEDSLQQRLTNISPLVFCLGDTTVGSCCPDEVAALHLQADVLVHYGHACLSPSGALPVIYSFGSLAINVVNTVQAIMSEVGPTQIKLLVLSQVGYYHAMEELEAKLSEEDSILDVVVGRIPEPSGEKIRILRPEKKSCCGGIDDSRTCCDVDRTESETTCRSRQDNGCGSEEILPSEDDGDQEGRNDSFLLAGLALPDSIRSWEDLESYTVLFVGEVESTSKRQYVNVMMRLLSLPNPPTNFWSYAPQTNTLSTSIPVSLRKQLNRRFFLSQKARDANVFGILVSNLSQQHLVEVVKVLKRKVKEAGKSTYSFAVGKINPAKLANFAEIECFVLVACREHSLLSNERDYPVPVITPLELDIALGNIAWGSQAYSLDCHDVLDQSRIKSESEDLDDDDAPYFSLVKGQYVQKATPADQSLDLELLPGQGKVTAYRSEAANFLQSREYQGLTTLSGLTEAKAAVAGMNGIASDYGGS